VTDATITFNTSVDPRGFESGVNSIDGKTKGLKEAIARLGMTIDDAFKAKNADEVTAAIIKQQGVVDALQQKLNDVATIEDRLPILEQMQRDLVMAEKNAAVLEDGLEKAREKLKSATETRDTVERLTSELDKANVSLVEMQTNLNNAREAIPELKVYEDTQNSLSSAKKETEGLADSVKYYAEQLRSAEIYFSDSPEIMGEAQSAYAESLRLHAENLENIAALEQKLSDIDVSESTVRGFDAIKSSAANTENTIVSITERLTDLRSVDVGIDRIKELKQGFEEIASKSSNAGEEVEALKMQLSDVEMPTQPKESAEELTKKLSIANKKLDEMKAKAKPSTTPLKDGMDDVGKSVEKTTNKIKNLVIGAFVFNTLRSAIKQFRDYVFAAAMENEAFARSFNQFKANIYAAIQPIITALMPALTRVADIFSYISDVILQIVATITNTNVQQLYAQARARDKETRDKQAAYQKEQEAYNQRIAKLADQRAKEEEKEAARIAKEIEKQEKARAAHADKHAKAVAKQAAAQQKYLDKLKKTNKEAQKTVAAFDDLVTLQTEATDELDNLQVFDDIPFEELKFEEITSNLRDAVVEGFNQGYQGGMFDKVSNPQELSQKVRDVVGIVMAIGAMLLLVIGAILAFTGVNIPLGIGMMVAGALILYKILAPLWNSLSDQVKSVIGKALVVVGIIALVIGCVLAFSGVNILVGIGLIAAGAAMLYAAIKMEKDALSNDMESKLSGVGDYLMLFGALVFIIGLILLCFGITTPIGLALMAAGAGAFAAGYSVTPGETFEEKVKGMFGRVKDYVGREWPLLWERAGIIWKKYTDLFKKTWDDTWENAKVAWGMYTDLFKKTWDDTWKNAKVAWNMYTDLFKKTWGDTWENAKVVWNKYTDLFKNTWEDTWASAKIIWDKFLEKIDWEGWKEKTVLAWWVFKKGAVDVLNFVIDVINSVFVVKIIDGINKIIDGFNLIPSVDIPRITWQIPNIRIPDPPKMPALARGAVLPGGDPFMAIVNDQPRGQMNVETPLDTMIEAFEIAFERHREDFGGNAPVIAKIEGSMAGFFRWLNIELKRDDEMASAFLPA